MICMPLYRSPLSLKIQDINVIYISHKRIIFVQIACSAKGCHTKCISLTAPNKTWCFPFSLLRTEPCWPLGVVNRSMMGCFVPLSPLWLDVWRASPYTSQEHSGELWVLGRGFALYVWREQDWNCVFAHCGVNCLWERYSTNDLLRGSTGSMVHVAKAKSIRIFLLNALFKASACHPIKGWW